MAFCNMAKHYSLKQTSSPHRGGKSFAVKSNDNEEVTGTPPYSYWKRHHPLVTCSGNRLFKQTRQRNKICKSTGRVRKEQEFRSIYAS